MPLKCGEPGCKATINAMTGLQELSAVVRHMKQKHGRAIFGMAEALEVRADWEAKQEAIPMGKLLEEANGKA